MAKITGDQTIPAEWRDDYIALLALENTKDVVCKRYPFKRPEWQAGGGKVTDAQKIQRERFKDGITLFADVDEATRQRWYNAAPEWNSFLWYYNYFIMSNLAGNANDNQGGVGVIKSIQCVQDTVGTGGDKSFAIDTVDPTKTVVMVYGNSYISDKVQRGASTIADGGSNNHTLSPVVDPDISEVRVKGSGGAMEISGGDGQGDWCAPYAYSLAAALLVVKMVAVGSAVTVGYDWEVIEHKAQTIYPVIKEINASTIVIDWPITPSVGADISILVIEYI